MLSCCKFNGGNLLENFNTFMPIHFNPNNNSQSKSGKAAGPSVEHSQVNGKVLLSGNQGGNSV